MNGAMATHLRHRKKEKKRVSQKPQDLAFKQQNLLAWMPIITPATFLPLLFIFGIVFVPVGAGLLLCHRNLKVFSVDYTHCRSVTEPNSTCYELVSPTTANGPLCDCSLPFYLPEDFNDQVFIYYKLNNYHQNHRLYARSRDDYQMRGHNVNPTANTAPLDMQLGLRVAPAGFFANSMFNDTIRLTRDGQQVALTANGISWPSDFNTKFQGGLEDDFKEAVKPPNWHHHVWSFPLEPGTDLVQGFRNQDFVNWMRAGVLNRFRKLYRRVVLGSLSKGEYILQIEYRYPTSAFEGEKIVYFGTVNALGGKNSFLGYLYVGFGTASLLLALVFLVQSSFYGRQLGDDRFLEWERVK